MLTAFWKDSEKSHNDVWNVFRKIDAVLIKFRKCGFSAAVRICEHDNNCSSHDRAQLFQDAVTAVFSSLPAQFEPPGKRLRDAHMGSRDELPSKFRPAEESHLWFNLGKGSGARQADYLLAQTRSLHTEGKMRTAFLGGVSSSYPPRIPSLWDVSVLDS